MENMRAELDNMFQLAPYRGRFLPYGGVTDRMLPAMQGEFRVDVREHDDEVIVVADLPGVEKDDVLLQIRTREPLRSRVNAKVRKRKNLKGYHVRVYGSMQRIVTMPADVSVKDAKASFKNGVLEVRLNKTKISPNSRIEIE